jgi:hypothetical protein
VSFSDPRVAAAVNSKFVAAWINRGPGFFNAEFWTEARIAEHDFEAYPTKNICTFFLTPERKVFYYAAGSYAPDMFLKILETAASLRTALFDDRMRLKEKGAVLAARLHEEKADAYQELKERAEDPSTGPDGWREIVKSFRSVSYRGLKHTHSAACAGSLRNGYDYLATLHRDWSKRTELPAFEDVRFRYLYGNDFTEECAGSTPITRPEPGEVPRPAEKQPKAARAKAVNLGDLCDTGVPFGTGTRR